MDNYELLLSNNTYKVYKNVNIINGRLIYTYNKEIFDGAAIRNLIFFINSVKRKYGKTNIPIHIFLGNVSFKDKLTYIFLEILCDILIRRYNHSIVLYFFPKDDILTEGIEFSPLLLLDGNRNNLKTFLLKFEEDLYKNHYRKVIKGNTESNQLSKFMDEITYFLIYSGVEETCAGEIAEVIAELVGNAWEHAEAECLVDLDVTGSYFTNNSNNTFLGINIAVVNFSSLLFGQQLEQKMSMFEDGIGDRYCELKKAYDFHKKKFDSKYHREDFFNIASYQHKISGRNGNIYTGGTGLTKLISSLEQRSYRHMCYMISGERALWFEKNHLEYDSNGWIGFNDKRDFFTDIPSENTFTRNTIYMPGTAYNLNFVMERGLENGE